jgi:hypothetical protein|nr:MAG TPA: hypothetical protein [Bacteriophage sp.]
MKELTKEQYEYLSKFDNRFKCAVRANYCRNIQKEDTERMRAIYEELIEQPYKMNINCGTCVLNLIKRLGVYYFEYVEKLKTIEDEGANKEESRETEKGRGRKGANRRSKD